MDYSTNAQVNLSVNGKEVENKLDKLEKKFHELQKAASKAAEIGDKGSLKKIQGEMKSVENQMRKVRTATANVEATLQQLDRATPKQLKKDLQTLKAQLNGLERGSEAWNAHIVKIKLLDAELKKINAEMREGEGWLSELNEKFNEWGGTIAAATAAITGIVFAGRSAVNAFSEMDAELANVRKFTGMTKEGVEELNEEFKKMNTRTSRKELNELAEEAGRLGKTSKEDVLGYVKAANVINVALDELGEGATLVISKLTNIFGEEQKLGTEQAMLSVGSVINELSQNSTAGAKYLAEFGQRLAGVGPQAKMSIPEIMAFGAVLDSQGQKQEMAATAFSKLVMDLFKQPEKIAKATGISLNTLTDALKKSTNEGLLLLLQRLNEIGNMDVLAPLFQEMGETGARAASVISVLAGNVDMIRQQQEAANVAFNEGISVTKEYAVQESTVEAGLEKARNAINELAVELGEKLMPVMRHVMSSTTATLKAMRTVVSFVSEHIYAITTITAAITAYTLAVNANNIATAINAARTSALTKAKMAYAAVVKGLTAAKIALNVALATLSGNWAKQSWWLSEVKAKSISLAQGWGILAAAGISVIAMVVNYVKSLNKVSESEKAIADIRKRGLSDSAEMRNRIQTLVKVARDENAALEDRIKATNQLNMIVPNYNAELDKTTGKYKENTAALDDYIKSLITKGEVEAAEESIRSIGREKFDVNNEINELKKKAEQANKLDEAMRVSGGGQFGVGATGLSNIINTWAKKLDKAEKKLQALEEKEKKIVDLYGKDIENKILNGNGNDENNNNNNNNNNPIPPTSESKDRLNKEREWRAAMEAMNRIEYATGRKNYEEYQKAMLDIEMQYQQKIMDSEVSTNAEKLEAQAAYEEAAKKLRDNYYKQEAEKENERYEESVINLRQRYVDGLMSLETYNNAVEQAELEHLRILAKSYEAGSDERRRAENNYLNKIAEDKKKREEKAEANNKKIKDTFFGLNSNDKDKEYQELSQVLDAVYQQEQIAAEGNEKEKLRIEEAYQKARIALAIKYGQEYSKTFVQKAQEANMKVIEFLESDEGQAITKSFDTMVAGMTSMFSGLTEIVRAELELQTEAIERRYDTEINAAEGNQVKVAMLEKKKEEELRKAKNESNRKQFSMQVVQALAQTAQAAIAAYSSAAAIPLTGWIMAPIAASMAVAAGMIQVAALKKQQQAAEATGYAEGGYTPKGNKYEPVGIVHAGEWVASQKLLADPKAAAIISSLDYAQRNNRIGAIGKTDVSRDISATSSMSRIAEKNNQGNTFEELTHVINALEERLNKPFVTVNTVTGDTGIKKAQDEYQLYLRNKNRK